MKSLPTLIRPARLARTAAALVRPARPAHERRARWWRTGLNMPEVISSYGLYALVVVAGIAGAAIVFNMLTATNVTKDLRTLITKVQQVYAAQGNYRGVDVLSMASSLPSGMVTHLVSSVTATSDRSVWVGGEYEVALAAGGAGQTAGAISSRWFILAIGALNTSPIEDPSVCALLANGLYPGLKAVQVVPALAHVAATRNAPNGAGGTGAPVAPMLGIAPAVGSVVYTTLLAPAGTGASATVVRLDERDAGIIQTNCETHSTAATGATVLLVLS